MASGWLIDWLFSGLESRLNAKLDRIQQSVDALQITDAGVARIKAATADLVAQRDALDATVNANEPKGK